MHPHDIHRITIKINTGKLSRPSDFYVDVSGMPHLLHDSFIKLHIIVTYNYTTSSKDNLLKHARSKALAEI